MKGITSVITVVLLTSVSVALASMYAGWAPDLAGDVTSNAAEDSEQATKCRNAALSIQNPVYDKNSNTVSFDVKNTGTILFSKKIEIVGINVTKINSTEIRGLVPGETTSTSFEAPRSPERLLAQSEECPGLRARANDLDVRN